MKLSDLSKTEAVVASEEAGGSNAPPADQPTGVVQVTTPSGIGIYYQSGPKRLYRVCDHLDATGQTAEQWTEVVSTSEVTDALDKGGLSWWGMKVGVSGLLRVLEPPAFERLAMTAEDLADLDGETVTALTDLLTEQKLTVNHVKKHAADRGTNVHTALELYAETGILPDPTVYPSNEEGYVRGLVKFLKEAQPEIELSEVMVASAQYGYAGRFDAVARLRGGKAVTKLYPKRPELVDVIDPEWRILLDLKTSKGVFESYHLQVAGYEGAFEESGYGVVDKTAIVRVTKDGKYELVLGRALPEDFLAVLDVYRIVQRIKKSK